MGVVVDWESVRAARRAGFVPLFQMNLITEEIIASAIDVHRELGPGLLESAYESCLFHELTTRGLFAQKQLELPLVYKGLHIDCGYRIDLMVEDLVIVELKSVEKLLPIHEAQLISYLKLSDRRLGLLLNFNVKRLVDGLRRIAHNL